MNLYDYDTIKRILNKHGFTFSKSLGQNFLIDPTVCPKMADCLNANSSTGVIEIGAGVGVLTKELCRVAGKVVTVELDKSLFPVLEETLGEVNNLELICGDVLKCDLKSLIEEKFKGFDTIKVCANLPYYITSPVIMTLLEGNLPIDEIVVMVQKEAGERLCASLGTRNAGALTVAVNYYAQSEILFDVGRECFFPSPKVDSVVIRLKLRRDKALKINNEKKFFAVVKAMFSQRRKSLANSLSGALALNKSSVSEKLNDIGIDPNTRAEKLTMDDFYKIYITFMED